VAEKRQPVQVVRCEEHGIAYNAAVESGCVKCRKERGGGAARRVTPSVAPRDSASALVQGLLALALIVGTGGLLFSAHRTLLTAFEGVLSLQDQGSVEVPPSLQEEHGD
jgi:hypothetical protein